MVEKITFKEIESRVEDRKVRERKTILGYDVEALKRDVERLKKEIEIFQQQILKHYEEIAKLEGYIRLIEQHRRNVSTIKAKKKEAIKRLKERKKNAD